MTETENVSTSDPSEPKAFPIVGLGASAGGVEALSSFFDAMPPHQGMAFMVVLHLSSDQESHLPEILGRHTVMTVAAAEDGVEVEPGHVYVLPPDRNLTLRGGKLRLAPKVEPPGHDRPIDVLFRSLAEELEERAICVVLSGSGSNGTAGLRSVHEAGGLALAQEPASAKFPSMPENAIATDLVDFVLPPAEMPQRLVRFAEHAYVRAGAEAIRETARRSDLQEILALVRTRTGLQLESYRKPTLLRRIHRRMGLRHVEEIGDYLELLGEDSDEVAALVKDLMIHVTGFFRDPEAWETLAGEVLPKLVREHGGPGPLRAWVPACASGEEAYGLAMLLTETVEDVAPGTEVKVFATDLSEEVVARARLGRYPASIAEAISPERLLRFFQREGDAYRVKSGLRERLVFAPHNLLQDPPFSRLDLISCRNLLIYIEPETQRRVLALLHFALREGGYLFLGSAETVGRQSDLFDPVSKKWRIFRRVGATRHDLVQFPLTGRPDEPGRKPSIGSPEPMTDSRLALLVRNALVRRFAPASVLVDRQGHVLYFQGGTEVFLSQPGGQPTQDLFHLARQGLRTPLRDALAEAVESGEHVVVPDVRVHRNGQVWRIRLTVTPVGSSGGSALYLVAFEQDPEPTETAQAAPAGDDETGLREDLRSTRVELRSTVEELETANEQLRASNEEVTSMNEELQSTNEELETAKEELQSLNEELNTANAQLQNKVEELEATTNDLSNLLNSTDIATLFLDRELRIGRYTPAIQRLLDVLPSDVGRPIHHLAQKFEDQELEEEARQVMKNPTPVEREVASEDGRVYLRRIVPYRTEDDRVDGVVITFTDITGRKRAEEELRRLNEELEEKVKLRTRHLQLLQDVAAIANEATTVDDAFRLTLQRVCDHSGWLGGQAYEVTGESLAQTTAISYGCDDESRFDAWLQERTLAPGDGLLRRVLETGKPHGLSDRPAFDHLGGEDAEALGIRSVILFPVLVETRVEALFECFSSRPIDVDPRTLEVMGNLGTHLGRVVERREMERRLIDLTEQEQRRLGEEIHDTLGQQITGLGMIAKGLQKELLETDSPGAEMAEKLVVQIRSTHDQLRTLAKGLTPLLETSGLPRALEELAEHCRELYGLHCGAEMGDVEVRDAVALSLYRIAREAVNNAAFHADASKIELRLLDTGDGLVLEVEDDGRGMNPVPPGEEAGLGLRLMRHRAALIHAELEIDSTPETGTVVRCRVPEVD